MCRREGKTNINESQLKCKMTRCVILIQSITQHNIAVAFNSISKLRNFLQLYPLAVSR